MEATALVYARWLAFFFSRKKKAGVFLPGLGRPVWLLGLLCYLTFSPSWAQEVPPSLYPYQPLTVNPAMVGTPNQMEASWLHRRSAGGGATNFASLSSPLMFAGGHWGGIGFQYTDERSGKPVGIRRQRIAGALAYSLKISARRTLSLGLAGGYQTRRIAGPAWAIRTADSRMAAARLAHIDLGGKNYDLSWGIQYRGGDRRGQERFYLGLSMAPGPGQSGDPAVDSRAGWTMPDVLASGGYLVWRQDRLSLMPQFLWAYRQTSQWASVGGKLTYALEASRTPVGNVPKLLEVGAHYRTERALALSLSVQGAAYGLGLSYNLPLGSPRSNGLVPSGPEIALRIFPEQLVSDLRAGEIKERQQSKSRAQKLGSQPRTDLTPVSGPSLPIVNPPAAVVVLPRNMPPAVQAKEEPLGDPAPKITPTEISFETPTGETLTLPPTKTLYFQSDQTEVSPGEASVLKEVVAELENRSSLAVRVIGHTDAVGPEQANIRLSFRRAQQIADFLLLHGISGERVVVEGRGPFNPRVLNNTPANRALNRRVEIMYEPDRK